ncbi:MAG: GNAT family N-acetyltransferase [Armatimonadota bacterium]
MSGRDEVVVRPARRADLRSAAEIYLAAFPDSVRELGLKGIRPAAVADVFGIAFAAEREAFLMADVGASPIGYVVCSSDVARLRWATLPILPGLVRRWLMGRYGVGLRAVLRLVRDKQVFSRHPDPPGAGCPARVLSLAVHPRGQGHGLGKALMAAALDYLRGRGATCVRLEVRPDNAAARHIYESLGFRDVGRVQDTRGPWDVMLLELGSSDD